MDNYFGKTFEQAAVVQKLWMDSAAKITGVFSQFSPVSPPIEEARKLRSGLLKVLGESCEEFMRTPQFMEMMKTSLNAALTMRQFQRAGMDAIHDQFETPDKEDIDGILLAIRHVERRLLDRLEDLDERVTCIDRRIEETQEPGNRRNPPTERPVGKRAASPRQKKTTISRRKGKK